MRVAVTGGTGFVGRHLVTRLAADGHEIVVVARGVDQRPGAREVLVGPSVTMVAGSVSDPGSLTTAFAGCGAVVHCAGINREVGAQTYQAVHVRGTANVVSAATRAGVDHLTLMSFLRARPDCGSPYHESKWAAEEIVRGADRPWTIVKPGMVHGRGDHFLDHLSHALFTFPIYVGIGSRRIRPLWVDDLVDVLVAAAADRRLDGRTVPVLGPTEIGFDQAVGMIADVVGRRVLVTRLPMAFHRVLAVVSERVMTVPLVSRAQVRMLEEQVIEPVGAPDELPVDLVPSTAFDAASIRRGLPTPGPFSLKDLRLCNDPTVQVR